MTHIEESSRRADAVMQAFLQRRDYLATTAFAALSNALDWLSGSPSFSDVGQARACIEAARERLKEIFPTLFEAEESGELADDVQAASDAYQEFRRAGGFV